MVQARLLEIAIREFSAKGIEGASTREIAAAAGTAMSSITYHYGGKGGLYLAAADYIASEMDDIAAKHSAEVPGATADPPMARTAIKAILADLVDKLAGERSERSSLFIAREQMNPTEAFERIYAGPMGRMIETLVDLVRIAAGTDDDEGARVTVLTLFGQVLVLRAGRATCARLLQRDPGEAGVIAHVQRRIAANVDAILDAMTLERREPA